MTAELIAGFWRKSKIRTVCAVLGTAPAVFAVAWGMGMSAMNEAQAPALVKKLSSPFKSWVLPERTGSGRGAGPGPGGRVRVEDSKPAVVESRDGIELDVLTMSLDYRPGGRVMQGPPLRAVVAPLTKAFPFDSLELQGEWPDAGSNADSAVVFESVFAARKLAPPPLGTELVFEGRRRTLRVKLAGIVKTKRSIPGFPTVFVSHNAFKTVVSGNPRKSERAVRLKLFYGDKETAAGFLGESESVRLQDVSDAAPGLTTDAQRNFQYGKSLMTVLCALVALCIIVNALSIGIDSNRQTFCNLRLAGMTGFGALRLAAVESFALSLAGGVVGSVLAQAALAAFAAFDSETYPSGYVFSAKSVLMSISGALILSQVAVLFVMRKLLKLKPLDAVETRTRQRRAKTLMWIPFAAGFGAFVAVETWGASLMSAFIPSEGWPDAIVSILPSGAKETSIGDLTTGIKGVRTAFELVPLQLDFYPPEPMESKRGAPPGRSQCRNVLLLGSDPSVFKGAKPMADFDFIETVGDAGSAIEAMAAGKGCIISSMMARARNLKAGDSLKVLARKGGFAPSGDSGDIVDIPVLAVVDVNWHMVTSRGLLRGLDGAPVMTDGPAFVSAELARDLMPDSRFRLGVTHLWLDYDEDFLKENGVFQAGRIVEDRIRGALEKAEGEDAGLNTVRLHNRDEIADGTIAHGASLIGAIAVVPFVFLAILGFGFAASVAARAQSMKSDLFAMRSAGASRVIIWRLLVKDALAAAFKGFAAGLPLGALLGWWFTSFTRAKMANWGIPPAFEMPPVEIALGAAIALVIVLVASAPAAAVLTARATARGRGKSPRTP